MDNQLNVLWIDDRYKDSQLLIEDAKIQFKTNIIPYEFTSAGIEEFIKNPDKYDAIILDAKGKDSVNEVDTTQPLYMAIKKLDRISMEHPIPFVVYTGQPDLMSSKDFETTMANVPVFKKPAEFEKMMNYLIEEIDKNPERRIKNKYRRVFELCSNEYIGDSAEKDLIFVLHKIETDFIFKNSEEFLNPLRKVIEDLLKAFNKFGFLPDCFVERSVAMNEASRFLSGEWVKDCLQTSAPFPDLILNMMKQVVQVCQAGSHRTEVDEFIRKNDTPFLLKAILFQLLDILIWFKKFVDQNNDKNLNQSTWRAFDGTGKIEKDSYGNYHVNGILIPEFTITKNHLVVGDRIKLLELKKNSQVSKKLFKFISIKLHKV
jgi:hypothetical protein